MLAATAARMPIGQSRWIGFFFFIMLLTMSWVLWYMPSGRESSKSRSDAAWPPATKAVPKPEPSSGDPEKAASAEISRELAGKPADATKEPGRQESTPDPGWRPSGAGMEVEEASGPATREVGLGPSFRVSGSNPEALPPRAPDLGPAPPTPEALGLGPVPSAQNLWPNPTASGLGPTSGATGSESRNGASAESDVMTAAEGEGVLKAVGGDLKAAEGPAAAGEKTGEWDANARGEFIQTSADGEAARRSVEDCFKTRGITCSRLSAGCDGEEGREGEREGGRVRNLLQRQFPEIPQARGIGSKLCKSTRTTVHQHGSLSRSQDAWQWHITVQGVETGGTESLVSFLGAACGCGCC